MERVIKMLPKGIPASAINDVECDPDNGSNGGSYWVYLSAGWKSPDDWCHVIHEDTLADLRAMVKGVEAWDDDPALPQVDAEAEQEADAADVVYVVCAYHVGVGEAGRVGTVTAKDEQDAWEKGYGLASERGGYEPDSVTVTVGKRYFFSMDACAEIEAALVHGEDVPELVLFVETPEIVEDFENNEASDWWPVWRCGDYSTEPGYYQSIDEAMEDYASNIGETVYCRVHDC